MKTWARAKVVANSVVKSVKAVVQGDNFSVAPDWSGFTMQELLEMAKEEGILRAGKDYDTLLADLKEEYEIYPV